MIVAQTMGPAELMDCDYSRIRGLIIEDGTPDHACSDCSQGFEYSGTGKAKSEFFGEIQNGQAVALDGNEGFVYVNPSPAGGNGISQKNRRTGRVAKEASSVAEFAGPKLNGADIGLYINVRVADGF